MAEEQISNTAEVEEQVAPESTAEEGQQVPESIGLNDLQLLAQIVDLATQRGAFRGNELTQIGVVYDKLSSFLGYVAEQQAQAQDADAPAEAEAEAPVESKDGE
tara:strand:+ start:2692 stop:3003 length:312 start_codon:yes stop_codon:yes gene_type:complete